MINADSAKASLVNIILKQRYTEVVVHCRFLLYAILLFR